MGINSTIQKSAPMALLATLAISVMPAARAASVELDVQMSTPKVLTGGRQKAYVRIALTGLKQVPSSDGERMASGRAGTVPIRRARALTGTALSGARRRPPFAIPSPCNWLKTAARASQTATQRALRIWPRITTPARPI